MKLVCTKILVAIPISLRVRELVLFKLTQRCQSGRAEEHKVSLSTRTKFCLTREMHGVWMLLG